MAKKRMKFEEYQRIKSIIHEDCCLWDSERKKCIGVHELCGRCNFYKTHEQYQKQTGMTYHEGMLQAEYYRKEKHK